VSLHTAAPTAGAAQGPEDDAIAAALAAPGLSDRLAVHYRPIVALPTGLVASIAARIRFTDPILAHVPPKHVVEVAERTGAIIPIGAWLIREAVHELAEILQAPRSEGPVGLSVKVSMPELAHEGFSAHVAEALTATGVTPASLVLELTHPPTAETADVAANLQQLRAMGVMLAVDESSMGPEAITRLRALRIGEMRIAPEICQSAPDDAAARATLSAIVGLARALGLVTVATGIQSAAQLDTARRLGVDRAQGALLGSPVPRDELMTWMKPR
jgi:EAL domain-containing protein (putative c-di-GMP-specific phosphodiesterase class I)